ncbi:MAG: lipoprotein insertase outer membrane protein LolB [Rhodanobacteraceae bacterium]
MIRAAALGGSFDFRGGILLALLLGIAGCAAPLVKSDSAHLEAQDQRELALAAQLDWRLEGRLAVSDGHDGGSGTLEWHQQGARFEFEVHAPITGKTWKLMGDPTHAVLSGLAARPIVGDNAAALIERELGWHVPVARLTAWVRGARAEGSATMTFRGDGLPAEIVQAGWTVRYADYDVALSPPLPTRIFASRGPYHVRLSVRHWSTQ